MKVFSAHRLFTPLEEIIEPLVFVDDAHISAISSQAEREIPANATVVDLAKHFPDAILAPGLIDIHMHGGAGVDVMQAAPSDMPRLHKFLASHGVTSYLPTTVGASMDEICAALDRLADAVEKPAFTDATSAEARPLGIHLEGPFLSHKRPGVHPLENLINPSPKIFERLWQAARGHIRIMTIAPELPGALEVIAIAASRNVLVSLGHSDSDSASVRAAMQSGARHATHTFNAMRPLDHRAPGVLGEALTNDFLSADIIADGIHVSPELVKLFLRAKGADRAVLITDATAATGMPDGFYQLGPIRVEVKDGKCMKDGSLAGSVLTLDQAVRNVMGFAGCSLRDSVRLAALNPAAVAGFAGLGQISVGAEANMVLLSLSGEVLRTIVHGGIG